ncbi:hypothetical protein Y032_0212g2243 [Ancylostoma ceylanicum]|uniref:Uncharacterized protein n=1 Tax=Ancylostoma ceylanicum TaxID=53326 RepID=A0A016SKQ5_9BILA|nr:hypothetical protein Y032_0212g2243 [Ancylostoma ceylanicum]
MWLILIIVGIVVVISVILVILAVKACCRLREDRNKNEVSLSFPLPPPTGDSDDMDETQYDTSTRVQVFRELDYGENGEGAVVERKEDYLPSFPPRRDKSKQVEAQNQLNKVPCFLFEAPPAYDEVDSKASTQSGDRRRMVSIKMPDLPVRKVGDTQILDRSMAPTQSLSVTTKTAHSTSLTTTRSKECVTQGTVEGVTPVRTPVKPATQPTRSPSSKPVKPKENNQNETPTLKISKPGEESNNSTPTESLKDAKNQSAQKKS